VARHLSAVGLTADAIRSEVEALLADDDMKKRLRAVAGELAEMDSGARVAEAIERLVAV
jgi:UDP:flavonoid glycosyltransferase YjiC (YdhE family)